MFHSIFDSRDARCKTPYGAVPCGTEVTFTLYPPVAEGYTSCYLLVFCEFADTRTEISLRPVGMEGDRLVFTGSFTAPDQSELVWYSFRFLQANGEEFLLDHEGSCWQQTVYDASFSTPDWFGQGVTYQIFPDRFCRPGHLPPPDAAGMVGSRVIHQSWQEPMELPEEQGDNPGRDFFGGTLSGITEKLDYLRDLHVTTLYLCPIFESESNHRYNTADYEKIDPLLGTEADFRHLCAEAKQRGIRVMLDGVFNHTGSNSRYFNANGFYPSPGAAQNKESPYYPWYTFQSWPDQYDAWWGVRTLPAVNETYSDYVDFIIEGENSIIRRWLRSGADAWRLDVADELPDEFIAHIRQVMMEEKPDSFLVGEVWEDGSNKISYDRRRKYLLGRETHGLMNYPFRVAALSYLRGVHFTDPSQSYGAEDFLEAMETIRENYPPDAFYSAMNLLGTHDTPRILTLLGTSPDQPPATQRERAAYRMTEAERRHGIQLLKVGAALLYTFPGSPTVYYGDEAGMEGFEDPLNRGTFPWGREDLALQRYFAFLGKLRSERPSLRCGGLRWLHAQGPLLAFIRELEDERTITVLNVGAEAASLTLPCPDGSAVDAFTRKQFPAAGGAVSLEIAPASGMILI